MKGWKAGPRGAARVAFVGGVCLAGTVFVFAVLAALNLPRAEREEKHRLSLTTFSVPTTAPQARRQRRELLPAAPRRGGRSAQPGLAPAPSLGTGSSSIRIEMPDLEETLGQGISENILGELKDVALTEDTVDTPPVLLAGQVQYPDRARQKKIEGRVLVTALVGTDGRVRTLKILESTPPGVFDEAVRQSLPGWSFRPATYRGQPVQVWVTIPIPFRMN